MLDLMKLLSLPDTLKKNSKLRIQLRLKKDRLNFCSDLIDVSYQNSLQQRTVGP